jgi:hypothetical protein
MALKMPDNPGLCDAMAQKYGALVGDGFICVAVSGKHIKIEDVEHSMMEGFEITNFNFHCSGSQPAMPTTDFLQGPVENDKKGRFV